MCIACEYLKSPKLLIKTQYQIVNVNENLKCILSDHAENPIGCVSCIKGYMRQSLFLFAQRYYDHSRFTVQQGDCKEHLFYEVRLNEIQK